MEKEIDSCFDVTMVSFDGAEICELVGLYIQSKLEKILSKSNVGLYRDNGVALLRNLNGQQAGKVKKNNLNNETNLYEVDFLDVSLILRKKTNQ